MLCVRGYCTTTACGYVAIKDAKTNTLEARVPWGPFLKYPEPSQRLRPEGSNRARLLRLVRHGATAAFWLWSRQFGSFPSEALLTRSQVRGWL
jgi:hypothetical protein